MPRGYFLDTVNTSDEGDRIKVEVGPIGEKRKRTFVLRKTMADSVLVEVTMERPLGITFERDTEGRVRIAEFVDGEERCSRRQHSARSLFLHGKKNSRDGLRALFPSSQNLTNLP